MRECTSTYNAISSFGFELFGLIFDKVECPLYGNTDIILETVDFASYEYRIHGMKIDKSVYKYKWITVTKDDQYQYFDTENGDKTR